MSIDYWLGVATPLVLVGAYFGSLFAWVAVTIWLEEHCGIVFAAKIRSLDGIDDYTLRNNIWWERSFGPVFVGGWYRETQGPKLNRWIGFGAADGPCVMVIRRVLA